MASKLEKMKLKQAKEREKFELKMKELEEETSKGKINLKTIQNGLKGNEINVSIDVSDSSLAAAPAPTSGTRKASKPSLMSPAASGATGGGGSTRDFQAAQSNAVALSSSGDVIFPVPAGPRVSDWSYTGDLDSNPPVIKSLTT